MIAVLRKISFISEKKDKEDNHVCTVLHKWNLLWKLMPRIFYHTHTHTHHICACMHTHIYQHTNTHTYILYNMWPKTYASGQDSGNYFIVYK